MILSHARLPVPTRPRAESCVLIVVGFQRAAKLYRKVRAAQSACDRVEAALSALWSIFDTEQRYEKMRITEGSTDYPVNQNLSKSLNNTFPIPMASLG